MESTSLDDLAAALRRSADFAAPIPPVIETQPDLTLDDAYEIQRINARWRERSGGRIVGHKIGLTSAAMQEALGIQEPDFGHLFADMFHLAEVPISTAELIAPRIEPEIAFVLGRRLQGPGLILADIVRAVDFVLPSLEIIDSRIVDWRISLRDTVADNASSAGVVLGTKSSRPHDCDLGAVVCTMTLNGSPAATGLGQDVLGHPYNALLWLANCLGEYGIALEPGHVVLPGSCTQAIGIRPGDVVRADFGHLGSVSATFC